MHSIVVTYRSSNYTPQVRKWTTLRKHYNLLFMRYVSLDETLKSPHYQSPLPIERWLVDGVGVKADGRNEREY
jgi:hypothetical protein